MQPSPAHREQLETSQPCLVAIGSNIGDRIQHLRAGITGLAAAPEVEVVRLSQLYETAPVGGPGGQGPYLNAALLAETTLDPAAFLALLHQIEAERARTREIRWGARTLDMDLLTYADRVNDNESLQIPHPRMHQRRFVMVPVCDIAPDAMHPKLNCSMQDICNHLPVEDGDLTLVSKSWWPSPK